METKIKSYKDLIVWQKAYKLTLDIYKITDSFPQKETFALVSQLRRASVSIPSNIAEGYRRGSKKEYRQFLRIAFGSAGEIETQLLLSKDIGYISEKKFNELTTLLTEVLKMLNTLIVKLG
jgi:four helix bundle protein